MKEEGSFRGNEKGRTELGNGERKTLQRDNETNHWPFSSLFLFLQDEEWSPEFLDSIFENNTDLLSVFDDPNKISEITSDLMEYEEHHSPLSSRHSDAADLEAFLLHPATISSSASDSGLSSDNLDL